ncbi:hypothetical protein M408DRAFT_171857 [Serendipita vermifera MAFF 305830]|uniref:Uncharacterized protein n=1 Tax=Serendipita vermifera MAFF 305830 TaxID=933852 RepID=A0A0C3B528_SERVB|nr:hypothetical protein M408DRAFT_171857 [Serendipita vermifera MAFF 305830]
MQTGTLSIPAGARRPMEAAAMSGAIDATTRALAPNSPTNSLRVPAGARLAYPGVPNSTTLTPGVVQLALAESPSLHEICVAFFPCKVTVLIHSFMTLGTQDGTGQTVTATGQNAGVPNVILALGGQTGDYGKLDASLMDWSVPETSESPVFGGMTSLNNNTQEEFSAADLDRPTFPNDL